MSCPNCSKISTDNKSSIVQIWEAELPAIPSELSRRLKAVALRAWEDNGLMNFEVPNNGLKEQLYPYLAVG